MYSRAQAAAVRTAALLVAATVAGSGVAVAQDRAAAEMPMTRESERYLREQCTWLVNEDGTALRDSKGEPIPGVDTSRNQVCTVEEVAPAAVRTAGSSKPKAAEKKADGEPTWADEPASSELGIGAVVGIVGAVIAAVVGLAWLFIEDFSVRLVPPAR